MSNHLIHITWCLYLKKKYHRIVWGGKEPQRSSSPISKPYSQQWIKQNCQIIQCKSLRILKATWKQVAEVSRKNNCFFQTAWKFWLTDEWWLSIIALKCLSGLSATQTASHVGIPATNSSQFPYASFSEAAWAFRAVKWIKFPSEVSQYKNANFKNQFPHCLPWDDLRRNTDLLKSVVSQMLSKQNL